MSASATWCPGRRRRRWSAVAAACLAGAVAGGCAETDAWLLDPSVLGRWEHTPTTVPILTRIASIEGPDDEFVEFTEATPADLIPETGEYRIGPGDVLEITLYDIPELGQPTTYQRVVNSRGFVDLPELGSVYISGKTASEATEAIQERMRAFIGEPLAYVVVAAERSNMYTVVGAVGNPGQYRIPTANYRLLEALGAVGGYSEAPEYTYVIRQVAVTEAARGRPTPPAEPAPSRPAPPTPTGERLIDIIQELTRPPEPAPQEPLPPPPPQREDHTSGGEGLARSVPVYPGEALSAVPGAPRSQPPPTSDPPRRAGPPPIDLIEPREVAAGQPAPQAGPAPAEPAEGTWVYVQGKWVKIRAPGGMGPGVEHLPGLPAAGEVPMTQRVIRIPTARLTVGDARYNIVIRPGDIIRVPPAPPGTIYVGGQVVRVGAYGLAERMTLTRAITSAGGLSSIAVPERVDLIRMVGPERQGIVRLNLRAIAEGTHPDVFLKANDHINVGTSFWATPLAVIRAGFRASYGFGFVADRNFGNDIFGPPPVNRFGE